MASLSTNSPVADNTASSLDSKSDRQPDSPSLNSQSEHEADSKLGKSISVESHTVTTNPLAPSRSFSVPETPGASYMPISNLNSQCSAGANDAVAAKGTSSAIGALKFYRPATSFYSAVTPFQHQKPDSNSSHPLESGLDTKADSDTKEREQEEAQLMLAVARAQHKVCDLEHQLVNARVEESDMLGNLYHFRMQNMQCRVAHANFDIGLIRQDISKNAVSFPSGYKRR